MLGIVSRKAGNAGNEAKRLLAVSHCRSCLSRVWPCVACSEHAGWLGLGSRLLDHSDKGIHVQEFL